MQINPEKYPIPENFRDASQTLFKNVHCFKFNSGIMIKRITLNFNQIARLIRQYRNT